MMSDLFGYDIDLISTYYCKKKVFFFKKSFQNVIILGDFRGNTRSEQMTGVRIRSDRNFHWLISDDVDTTAKTSNEHTYDRHVYSRDLNS